MAKLGRAVTSFAGLRASPALPKTGSAKIKRRILRKIAEGDVSNLGDTSTLTDPSVVEALVSARP